MNFSSKKLLIGLRVLILFFLAAMTQTGFAKDFTAVSETEIRKLLNKRNPTVQDKQTVQNFIYQALEYAFNEDSRLNEFNENSKASFYNCAAVEISNSFYSKKRIPSIRYEVSDLLNGSAFNDEVKTCALDSMAAELRTRLAATPPVETPKLITLAVSDVLLDYASYTNKVVTVSGYMVTMGEGSLLYEKQMTGPFMFVDTKNLPREDRKKILKDCPEGCMLTIKGRVGDVTFQKGITAISLE